MQLVDDVIGQRKSRTAHGRLLKAADVALYKAKRNGRGNFAFFDPAQDAGVFGYLVKPASANQLRAAIDVAWGRFVDSLRDQEEIAALERKIEDRRIIERAKWILVQRKQVTEEKAMRTLQRQARQTRKKMAEVAQLLIDANDLL